MGTYYKVTYRGQVSSSALKREFERRLLAVEDQLSNWNKDSWVRSFNRRDTTGFVPIPNHATRVLRRSLQLADRTNGALDPTMGQLLNLWGFGPFEADPPPKTQALQKALQSTGPEKLTLKNRPPQVAKAHSGLHLNLSATAKGYAVDVLARHLEAEGITVYKVNIGGDIRVRGQPGGESAWTIVIQKPAPGAQSGSANTKVSLSGAGAATSGDYRRFRSVDGQRYPHVLNPETGRPIQSNLASVTVIAPTALRADGLATACLVLGLREARKLIARTPDAEGLFIERQKPNRFRTHASSGWPRVPDSVRTLP
jgi:thiamine biosynthesis lipoprotein